MHVRTSVSFPEKMKKALEMLAKRESRTLSGYISIVLKDHLNSLKKSKNL